MEELGVALELTEEEKVTNTIDGVEFVKKPVYDFFKRLMDIICSLVALIVLSPIMLITAILIFVEDKGSPFFTQQRVGKNEKVFKMYKFRSMRQDAEKQRNQLLEMNEVDGPLFKIAKDPRVTKIGKFIRKTSIDELPQLINILKGEMTIVGPRPLPTYEQDEFDEEGLKRLIVKPGLTCYWQISGRNDIAFNEFVRLDFKYINDRSIMTDLKIILKTFKVVLLGKGAY